MGQGQTHHLLLGDEAMADMGGKFAHILPLAWARVGIAAGGIEPAHARGEGRKMRQCRSTGWGDIAHAPSVWRKAARQSRQALAKAWKARAR